MWVIKFELQNGLVSCSLLSIKSSIIMLFDPSLLEALWGHLREKQEKSYQFMRPLASFSIVGGHCACYFIDQTIFAVYRQNFFQPI